MGVPNLKAYFEALARGDAGAAQQLARALEASLTVLHAATGTDPQAHVDMSGPGGSQVQAKPPKAKLAVVFVNPSWDIQITNPQYIIGQSASQIQQLASQQKNKRFADIEHQLQWSPTSNFGSLGTSNTFPVSKQTHYTPVKPAGTWWRVRSSFDGFNWNDWSQGITG